MREKMDFRLTLLLLLAACANAVRTIVCVGDSITFGSHSSDSNKFSYPAQLQVRLDVAYGVGAYEVTNLGVSGATAQKSGDKPYWNTDEYQILTSRSWDVAFIMLGTNDAKRQNWRKANAGCAVRNGTCAFARDLNDLVSSIRADVKFLGIPPPLTTDDNAYNMSQRVINEIFPRLIPNTVLRVDGIVDVFSALGGSSKETTFPIEGCPHPTLFLFETAASSPCVYYCSMQSCDSCHPNDVGYARLAETFAHSLLSRFPLQLESREL